LKYGARDKVVFGGHNFSYTKGITTAIVMPDPLFQAAEGEAARRKIS